MKNIVDLDVLSKGEIISYYIKRLERTFKFVYCFNNVLIEEEDVIHKWFFNNKDNSTFDLYIFTDTLEFKHRDKNGFEINYIQSNKNYKKFIIIFFKSVINYINDNIN